MRKLLFITSFVLGVSIGLMTMAPPPSTTAQQPTKTKQQPTKTKQQKPVIKYARGHKQASPAVTAKLHTEAYERHGNRVAKFPRATAAQFDCRTAFGNVLPVNNQGPCGDCFGVSAMDGASMALIKAGQLPNDTTKGRLSSQYGLDNRLCFQGQCDGGDEAQVIDYLKNTGAPLTSDYGPYVASPQRPKDTTGMKFWKIADYGFCTPSQQQGIASVQDIKNCMVQYGPISVAFDASGCDNYQWPQIMKGRGSNVDHAVLCIGWDDSKNAFLGMNQWGAGWGGPNGTFWIDYGSYSWGTESIWMTANTLPPPPPPPPPPPGPSGHVKSAILTFVDGTTQTLVPESVIQQRIATQIIYSDGTTQTIPPPMPIGKRP